jgi:signal peptidase II
MNLVNNLNKKKIQFLKKENIFYSLLIMLIFILDRVSKIHIVNNFNENTYFVNSFINLDLIWNTGIGFGLLSSDTSIIYNSITFLIGFLILILLNIAISLENLDKIIFSIIIGGALGNFYDRIIFNAVPDFIDLHFNNFHWFTFNIADIFISLGIIGYLMKGVFLENK